MLKAYGIAGAAALALIAAFFLLGGARTDDAAGPLTPARQFDHAHGMAVDGSKVYIATHDGLYLLEGDTALFRVGANRDDMMGFTAHPTEPNVFFSSGHRARGGNIGLERSTDGGMTWEVVSPGSDGPADFHAMTISAADPNAVYGFFAGRLQRSADGGRSWEYAKGNIRPISLSSDPERKDVVYAATESGVQVSTDRGDTWESLSLQLEGGAVSVFTVHPADSRYALAFAERLGGLGRSSDGGATWQSIPESFGGGLVLYLAFSKADPGVVYALTGSNAIYKSADRGLSWSKIR